MGGIFGEEPKTVSDPFTGQVHAVDDSPKAHLVRVEGKIGELVAEFVLGVTKVGGVFTMNELTSYVMSREPVAPDSPGRILRQLKRKGVLNYRVKSRKNSQYEVLK